MAVISVATVVPALAAGAVYVRDATSSPSAGRAGTARTSAAASICAAPSRPGLAARLSGDLLDVLHRRFSTVELALDDRRAGLTCRLGAGWRVGSASLVKLTVLVALLRMRMEQHQFLARSELNLTAAMITASDGSATSALWQEIGRRNLRDFLGVAGMTHTILGPGSYWGLTEITAGDEMRLLDTLATSSSVLDRASREYALRLMASVIGSQRWGVPAGAPAGETVTVQDGWMPTRPGDWRVNSIGTFTGRSSGYEIVLLTQANSTMRYGVATIEDAAEVIHRDLSPGAAPAVPRSTILRSQERPDEELPPLPRDP